MSPRPKIDRVPFSIRLTRRTHTALVDEAHRQGLSLNQAVEQAVVAWTNTRVGAR